MKKVPQGLLIASAIGLAMIFFFLQNAKGVAAYAGVTAIIVMLLLAFDVYLTLPIVSTK
jgi:hypothetical protein